MLLKTGSSSYGMGPTNMVLPLTYGSVLLMSLVFIGVILAIHFRKIKDAHAFFQTRILAIENKIYTYSQTPADAIDSPPATSDDTPSVFHLRLTAASNNVNKTANNCAMVTTGN